MKSTVGDETHWLWLLIWVGKYLLVYLVLYDINLNIFELFLLVTQNKQPVHVTLPLGFFFFVYQPKPQLINGENHLPQIKQGGCSLKVRKRVKQEDFLSCSVRPYLILWRYKIKTPALQLKLPSHSIACQLNTHLKQTVKKTQKQKQRGSNSSHAWDKKELTYSTLTAGP